MGKGRVFVFPVILFLLFAALPATIRAAEERQVAQSIIFNNGLVELKRPLLLEKGRILISLVDFVQLFAVDCEQQGEDSILLKDETTSLTLHLGNNVAVVAKERNFQVSRLDATPRLEQNIPYLPLRFSAESFGAEVNWDRESRCVLVTTAHWVEPGGIDVDYIILSRWDLQEEEKLSAWYEQNHRTEGLYSLTINGDTYILLSAGMRPTGGYYIRLESVRETSPGNLLIKASMGKPGPDDMVTMAFTYPNALLKFSGRKFTTIDSALMD